MTTSPIIRVDGLGKRYRLGHLHVHSIRELVNSAFARFFSNPSDRAAVHSPALHRQDDTGDFWALKDVSFTVPAGEVVGVIGRNGAGKSTLLKILSNIVAPTAGRVELRGRVASLLEVGTGFHPELTGRENVFLNGTILGMTKADVRRRFDEIVAFAGVERFIDTPVKRYSSGMTVRLAFAVAAYLESEILIIDEVLAVGDLEFQKKCLGRMQAVSASGRTVLFVSHNMPSVRALTSRSLVLSNGQILFDGPTSAAIEHYTRENAIARETPCSVADMQRPFGGLSGELRLESLELESTQPITAGGEVIISMGVRGLQPAEDFIVGLTVFRDDESPVGSMFSEAFAAPAENLGMYRFALPTEQLAPGRYHCAISLAEARSSGRRIFDSLADVLRFEIEPGPLESQSWPAVWGPIRFAEMRCLSQAVESVPQSMEAVNS